MITFVVCLPLSDAADFFRWIDGKTSPRELQKPNEAFAADAASVKFRFAVDFLSEADAVMFKMRWHHITRRPLTDEELEAYRVEEIARTTRWLTDT